MQINEFTRQPNVKLTAYSNQIIWDDMGIKSYSADVIHRATYDVEVLQNGTVGAVFIAGTSSASLCLIKITNPDTVSQWSSITRVVDGKDSSASYDIINWNRRPVIAKDYGSLAQNNSVDIFYERTPAAIAGRDVFFIRSYYSFSTFDTRIRTNLIPVEQDNDHTLAAAQLGCPFVLSSESFSALSADPDNNLFQRILPEYYKYQRQNWFSPTSNYAFTSCRTLSGSGLDTVIYIGGQKTAQKNTLGNGGIYALFTDKSLSGFYSDPYIVDDLLMKEDDNSKTFSYLAAKNCTDEIILSYYEKSDIENAHKIIRSKDGANFSNPIYLPSNVRQDIAWVPFKYNGLIYLWSKDGLLRERASSSVTLDNEILSLAINAEPDSAARVLSIELANGSNSIDKLPQLQPNSRLNLELGYTDQTLPVGTFYIDSVKKVQDGTRNSLVISARDSVKKLKNTMFDKVGERQGGYNFFDDFVADDAIGRPYINTHYWIKDGDIGWGAGSTLSVIELNTVGEVDGIWLYQALQDLIADVRCRRSTAATDFRIFFGFVNDTNYYAVRWQTTGVIKLEEVIKGVSYQRIVHTVADTAGYHDIRIQKNGTNVQLSVDGTVVGAIAMQYNNGKESFGIKAIAGTALIDSVKISNLDRILITETIAKYVGAKGSLNYDFQSNSQAELTAPVGTRGFLV